MTIYKMTKKKSSRTRRSQTRSQPVEWQPLRDPRDCYRLYQTYKKLCDTVDRTLLVEDWSNMSLQALVEFRNNVYTSRLKTSHCANNREVVATDCYSPDHPEQPVHEYQILKNRHYADDLESLLYEINVKIQELYTIEKLQKIEFDDTPYQPPIFDDYEDRIQNQVEQITLDDFDDLMSQEQAYHIQFVSERMELFKTIVDIIYTRALRLRLQNTSFRAPDSTHQYYGRFYVMVVHTILFRDFERRDIPNMSVLILEKEIQLLIDLANYIECMPDDDFLLIMSNVQIPYAEPDIEIPFSLDSTVYMRFYRYNNQFRKVVPIETISLAEMPIRNDRFTLDDLISTTVAQDIITDQVIQFIDNRGLLQDQPFSLDMVVSYTRKAKNRPVVNKTTFIIPLNIERDRNSTLESIALSNINPKTDTITRIHIDFYFNTQV